MSFIKNFTEKLLENEFRPVANFYNSKNIGENTEHLGLIKQIGAICYGVVIINADKKYDYKGFYYDVLNFFKQVDRIIVIGVFISNKPSNELIEFTTRNIEDFNDKFIDVRWTVNINENKIIVNGQQPDKILDLKALIEKSFHNGSFSVSQDLSVLQEKSYEKRKSYIKSNNIWLTIALILINGIIEFFSLSYGKGLFVVKGGISNDVLFNDQWYRLFTYMFIHGSLYHFLGNALSLYILGSRVEKYFGKVKMVILYLIAGLGAGILSMLFSGSLAVGASGAIFGLMAGILIYTKVTNRSVEGFDTYFVIVFAIIGIFSGFLFDNVDNWGHIGGFVTGLIASNILLKGEKENEEI